MNEPTPVTTTSASRPLTAIEKIAAIVSVAILISAAVFWIIQIRSVMQTLEAAYG